MILIDLAVAVLNLAVTILIVSLAFPLLLPLLLPPSPPPPPSMLSTILLAPLPSAASPASVSAPSHVPLSAQLPYTSKSENSPVSGESLLKEKKKEKVKRTFPDLAEINLINYYL
jgi:hypothetical protein